VHVVAGFSHQYLTPARLFALRTTLLPLRTRFHSVFSLDHLAIAVRSLDDSSPFWAALLGRDETGREEVPSEGVRVAFFGEGDGRVELLEPTDPESGVGRYLETRGPGLHHVCLSVPDLDAALDRAEDAGAETIPPRIREGAGGRRVAFLHPSSADGVLVELAERETDEVPRPGEARDG